RILVPAHSATVLTRALGDALQAAGLHAEGPGAFLGRGLQLRVLAEAGYVRIEAALAASSGAAELYTELQARPRGAAAFVMTPALHFALRASDPLRVYLRPGVLADLNRARSAELILAALANIDPDIKTTLALKGWSETAGGELIFKAGDAEMVDGALAL